MATGSAGGRPDEPWFGDAAKGFRSAAVDLLRVGGIEAVSLPALALRTGHSVTEVAAVFPTSDTLRDRLEEYLAVDFCQTLLTAHEDGGRPATRAAVMALSEDDPAVVRQVLTGPLFSAGEDLALQVARVLLPEAEIPEHRAERTRWFDYLRSHLHAAVLTAAEYPDPDRQTEILDGAHTGALTVSELLNSIPAGDSETDLASPINSRH